MPKVDTGLKAVTRYFLMTAMIGTTSLHGYLVYFTRALSDTLCSCSGRTSASHQMSRFSHTTFILCYSTLHHRVQRELLAKLVEVLGKQYEGS